MLIRAKDEGFQLLSLLKIPFLLLLFLYSHPSRAIISLFSSDILIVLVVDRETEFTIADFVADVLVTQNYTASLKAYTLSIG
jgi:hypothetical protein